MRRVALRAWVLLWLTLVWILLWGTVSAANIISGLVIALVITLLLPLPGIHTSLLLRSDWVNSVGVTGALSRLSIAGMRDAPNATPSSRPSSFA